MIPPSRSGLTLRRNRNKPLRGRQYLTRLMRGFCARWANRISVASTPEYRERRPWRAAKTDLPKPQHIAVSIGLGVGNANDLCMGNANTKGLVLVNATPSLRPTLAALRCYRLANVCALNVGLRKSKGLALPNTITVKEAKHNDHRAWGEARCPSQTQTRQGGLGWGAGSWAWPSLGPWPWRWAWRVGLGLAAALIGTSALSIPPPSNTVLRLAQRSMSGWR